MINKNGEIYRILSLNTEFFLEINMILGLITVACILVGCIVFSWLGVKIDSATDFIIEAMDKNRDKTKAA